MNEKICISQATLDELTAFSCKIEILQKNIEILPKSCMTLSSQGGRKRSDRYEPENPYQLYAGG